MKKILVTLGVFLFLTLSQNLFAQDKYITYKVQYGESMKSIAKKYGVKKRELMNLNPDVGKRPSVNTMIIIPNKNYVKPTNTSSDIHVVQQGETLFSISKRYEVSLDELKRYNGLSTNEISLGMELILPKSKKVYKVHFVQPKETLYSISKLYNISQQDLLKSNPQLEDGVKIGQRLQIPEKIIEEPTSSSPIISETPSETLPVDTVPTSDITVYHEVIKGDTFYNLSKRYNTTEDSIKQMNPHAVDGLQLGMLLKMIQKREAGMNNVTEDSTSEVLNAPLMDQINFTQSVDIAFLLPLEMQKLNDSINPFDKKNSLLNVATDFYLGAEIAMDSIRKQGGTISFNVYDTKKSDVTINSLLQSQNLDAKDAIIGPLYFERAKNLASKVQNTYVVSPIYSRRQEGVVASGLVKAGIDKEVKISKIATYIKNNYQGQKIIIVSDLKPDSKKELGLLVSKLSANTDIVPTTVFEEKGYIDYNRLRESLDVEKENWVVYVGINKTIATNVVSSLAALNVKYSCQFFAVHKDKNFDKDNLSLAGLQFTFPQQETFSNEDKDRNTFIKAYQRKNKLYPSKYAFQGFDVTYDIIMRIMYGADKGLNNGLVGGKSSRINSNFNYTKKGYRSFENNEVKLLQYTKDLKIIELK